MNGVNSHIITDYPGVLKVSLWGDAVQYPPLQRRYTATTIAPISYTKAATSTPMNISLVHATHSAKGATMRTIPNKVNRMSGTLITNLTSVH